MALVEGAGAAVLAPRGAAASARSRPRPHLLARSGLMPWLPLWLACGIGAWLALPFQPSLAAHLAIWAAAGGLWLAGRVGCRAAARGRLGWGPVDGLRLLALAVLTAAAGFSLAGWRSEQVAAPVLDFRYYGPVEGRLIGVDRSGRDRLRLVLDEVVLRDMAPARTPAMVRLSLMLPDDAAPVLPRAGTRVMLTGHLGPPPGPAEPGGFDFRRDAWFQGLGAVGYTRTPVLTVAPAPEGGAQWVTRLRLHLSDGIRSAIPGQPGAVASAITTGDRSGLEEATNQIMRDSNLYHIISISGLHMSMLAGFVYLALRFVVVGAQALGAGPGLAAHKLAAVGALAASAAYLVLAGGDVPTRRAFVTVAVMLVGVLADRRGISLHTLALAAVLLMIVTPEAVASAGFQMSFAATAALILVNDYWRGAGRAMPGWIGAVVMAGVTSIVAGLATGPIAAAHFNRISHYGLLANMAVAPVMGLVVMPAAVIAALLAPFGLAGPALWAMGVGSDWMLIVAAWTSALKGSVSAVPRPDALVLPLMGLGGVLVILTPWERMARAPGLRAMLRQTPRRAWAALLLMALSLGLWLGTARPALLIGPEGEAVALMTAAGRVPSKASGGAFVVDRWLLADGEVLGQAAAAARTGWQGPRNAREAALPWGGRIHHLTGQGAEERAADACRTASIVVLDRAAPAGLGPCRVIDLQSLRRSGALAFDAAGRETGALALIGQRPWNGARGAAWP